MLETTEQNESKHFSKLVERVHFLKEQMKGESEMCEIFDAVRKDGRDEEIEVARKEDITNLMKSLSLSLEDS